MVLSGLTLFFALVLDRLIGDPRSNYHPVALLGKVIGFFGKTNYYPKGFEKFNGVIGWFFTVSIFTLPFLLVAGCTPWYVTVPVGAVLLSFCIGWRSLLEHVKNVEEALSKNAVEGRAAVQMLVSRNVSKLSDEHIRSAAYESASENLVDSIVAPIFWFAIFEIFFGLGICGAALFRAANTMDAMLGYKDERVRLGWFSARMDDILAYIPARVTGAVLLLLFTLKGRGKNAYAVFKADRKKRPGFNGGVSMSLIAGGCGVLFEKDGVYKIGISEKSLKDGGKCILRMIDYTTIFFSGVCILFLILFF